MTTNYVLLPMQYHNIWALYKDLQSAFWTAEDVLGVSEVEAKGLESDEAQHLLAFVGSSHARTTSTLASALGPAPEFGCFLGLQVFLESVHLEGAARIVNEGAGTSPPVAIRCWTTPEQCGADGNPLSILLYCCAFWAVWSTALGAWRAGLQTPVHAALNALTSNMHRDGLIFVKFAVEMLCSVGDKDEVNNAESKALLCVYYSRLAADMKSTLGVEFDADKGYNELASDIGTELHKPRNVTVRKKREAEKPIELDAEF